MKKASGSKDFLLQITNNAGNVQEVPAVDFKVLLQEFFRLKYGNIKQRL